MAILRCKMCGGTMEILEGTTVAQCDYCGTKQTVPNLNDERKANLYDRANHFRRNNEYDKAMSIYERILDEDGTDAEAYWSLVLCRYGVEYVEDPATGKRVPTVNRTQYNSILNDSDYKATIEHADTYQKEIYEAEAKAIDDIQKGILEISSKEEPFDVFICYKETDNDGRRTRDSVLATDLYHQLTQEGFKVFFSRISLEDKLGTEYEPYIFAALNSAKVMVVLGTKPEFFNAVWVKNEWSRYLTLIKNGAKKALIPAYRDMDPYDLPEEFSHLQAQDMSKLGFMQDLIRGIKKIASSTPTTSNRPSITNNVDPLLRRVTFFLEDEDWKRADAFCEQVLNQEPENAQAYVFKLMIDLRVKKQEELADCESPFDQNSNYQRAMRFANEGLSSELAGYITHINERIEYNRLSTIYDEAVRQMDSATGEAAYKKAADVFESIKEFKDSASLSLKCLEMAEASKQNITYSAASTVMNKGINFSLIYCLEDAIRQFESIIDWRDSKEKVEECQRAIEAIRIRDKEKERERLISRKRTLEAEASHWTNRFSSKKQKEIQEQIQKIDQELKNL